MSHIYLLHQIHPCHIFWILKFRHRGKLYFHFLLQLLQILLHHRHVVAQRGRLVDQVLLDVLGEDRLPDPESFPEENGRRDLLRPLEDPLRGENRNFRIPGRHLLVRSTSKYQRHSICLSPASPSFPNLHPPSTNPGFASTALLDLSLLAWSYRLFLWCPVLLGEEGCRDWSLIWMRRNKLSSSEATSKFEPCVRVDLCDGRNCDIWRLPSDGSRKRKVPWFRSRQKGEDERWLLILMRRSCGDMN